MSRRNLNYLPVLFIGLFFSFFSISNLRADVTEEQWNETLLDKAVESFDEICSENKVQNPVSAGGYIGYMELRKKMKRLLHPTPQSINIIPKTPFEMSFKACVSLDPSAYGECMEKWLEAYANELAIRALSEIYGISLIIKKNKILFKFPEEKEVDKKD